MAATLVASDLTIAIAFGAVDALVVALATFIVGVIVDALGDGDAVADVQRFIELSAEAHASLPDGPLLSDPNGDTSAAISRLLEKKEQARQALRATLPASRRRVAILRASSVSRARSGSARIRTAEKRA